MPTNQHYVLEKHLANLNARLDWKFVFHNIGAQPPPDRAKREPLWVICPKCGIRRGHMFRDRVFGGFWFYCHGCAVGSDLIELAASVMQCPLEKAAKTLLPGVTDTEVSEYILQYPHYRQKSNNFWKRELLSPETDDATRDLMLEIGVRIPPDNSWHSRMGSFLAACAPETLDSSMAIPGKELHKPWPMTLGVAKHEMWKHNRVLLSPCRDLPGRISGFYMVGRALKPACEPIRETYLRILPQPLIKDKTSIKLSPVNKPFIETGYLMDYTFYNGLDTDTNYWCFIMLQPLVALQAQAQHLYHQTVPLPIAAAMMHKNHAPWSAWEPWRYRRRNLRKRRKYLFWGLPEQEADLRKLARMAAGRWCIQPTDQYTYTKPRIWLQTLINNRRGSTKESSLKRFS